MPRRLEPNHPLRLMFAGLVEQVFMSELGIADTRLTAYLAEVLSEFIHMDQIFRMRAIDGQAIRDISRVEADAFLGPDGDTRLRRRIVHQYIGDFTLFWIGVYPESLRPRLAGVDRLNEYLLQGKRGYGIASELEDPELDPPSEVLRQLSEEFESCVHGLRLVRGCWENADNSN
ncbi:MAG: hypothetical protein KDA32_13715 [Phycisphaerales bacterium]|nr:hypothetical protein [Phycisphaerales bacterium]